MTDELERLREDAERHRREVSEHAADCRRIRREAEEAARDLEEALAKVMRWWPGHLEPEELT